MRSEQSKMSQPSDRRFFALWMIVALAVVVLSFSAASAFSQNRGNISGTVVDPQGAVIPGAAVQLRNTGTNVIQTTQTDSAGFYRFPVVGLGTYEVTITKTGFEKFVQTNIVIDIDTAARADAVMKVGAQTEQVEVNTTTAQVDTENQQLGEVIGGQEIVDLPLDGRAYTDLLALQPGVLPFQVQLFGTLAPENYLNNGGISMAGAQDTHSGFTVNGANTVEGYSGGTFLIPTLDSICRVPHHYRKCECGIWKLRRRSCERRHQVRHQRFPRQRLGIPAQHGLRCEKLWLTDSRRLPPEPVRSYIRRADLAEPRVLLWRLGEHPSDHRTAHW